MIETLWWLIVGHFLADFILQNETVALNKRRLLAARDMQSSPVRAVPWWFWMAAHAMTHGLFVFLFTGSSLLGFLESVCHFGIDAGKCEGWYGLYPDQIMHIACKVTWVIIVNGGFR